jgi:hypothetical protein
VEELVVTEHARERVGPPAGVDDRAERVADTAGQNEGGRSRARSVEDLREVKDEQAERGVGAGDQSEDACVIEPP